MTKKAGAKYPCTQCDKTFETPAARGSHMRIIHGVAGTSYDSKEKREKREALKESKDSSPIKCAEMSDRYTELRCPDCDLAFKGKAALSNHRRAQHGLPRSQEAERRAKYKTKSDEITVPAVISPEGNSIDKRKPEPEVSHSQIDTLLFAFAVGQIKEQCRRIAEEHDVPTKLFTRQFAELFLREARR